MQIEATKYDENTLQVKEIYPAPAPVVKNYSRLTLEQEIVYLNQQKTEFNQGIDEKIAKVQSLLDLCDEKGIVLP